MTVRFLGQCLPLLALAMVGITLVPSRMARVLAVPSLVALVGSLTFSDEINEYNRFLLPTWPAWVLAAMVALDLLVRRGASTVRYNLVFGATALALAGAMLGQPGVSADHVIAFAQDYADCREVVRRQVGEWLKDHVAPGEVYGVSDAGLIPLLAGGTALDLFSLNDPSIQKTGRLPDQKWAAEVLRQKPAWLVLRILATNPTRAKYGVEKDILADEAFTAYESAQDIELPDCDYHLEIFHRHAP